jgi:hypothetical protein
MQNCSAPSCLATMYTATYARSCSSTYHVCCGNAQAHAPCRAQAQPANSGHAKRHRPAQCRAATVPAPPPPPPSESGQDYEAYQQLLLELSTRKSFEELRLFLDKHQAVSPRHSTMY